MFALRLPPISVNTNNWKRKEISIKCAYTTRHFFCSDKNRSVFEITSKKGNDSKRTELLFVMQKKSRCRCCWNIVGRWKPSEQQLKLLEIRQSFDGNWDRMLCALLSWTIKASICNSMIDSSANFRWILILLQLVNEQIEVHYITVILTSQELTKHT